MLTFQTNSHNKLIQKIYQERNHSHTSVYSRCSLCNKIKCMSYTIVSISTFFLNIKKPRRVKKLRPFMHKCFVIYNISVSRIGYMGQMTPLYFIKYNISMQHHMISTKYNRKYYRSN